MKQAGVFATLTPWYSVKLKMVKSM